MTFSFFIFLFSTLRKEMGIGQLQAVWLPTLLPKRMHTSHKETSRFPSERTSARHSLCSRVLGCSNLDTV